VELVWATSEMLALGATGADLEAEDADE